MANYHAHYTGEIPFMIWWLIVAIGCIVLGSVLNLSVLTFIGIVLFVFWIGIVLIMLAKEFS